VKTNSLPERVQIGRRVLQTLSLGQRGFGPRIALRNEDREVKAMTYIPNNAGMVSVEDSHRILRAIFPNYPDLTPCYPAPTLEPVAPSPVTADFEVVVA